MRVQVNDNRSFDIDINNDEITVNGQGLAIDSRELNPGHAHFIYEQKSYKIELVAESRAEKTAQVKVNGNLYQVSIEDQYDQLLKRLGLDNLQTNRVKEVKAPMPGLVLNILVSEGQQVNKGDSLLVLEAMKMENVIKSPTEGTIKSISIQKSDKVDKNEVLLSFA